VALKILGSVVAVAVATVILMLTLTGGEGRGFEYEDPFDPFPAGGTRGASTEVERAPDPQRQLGRFLPFVVEDIQGFWARTFEESGRTYEPAGVTVFRGALLTTCGQASPATGPFYCTLDRTVYLDLGFFRALAMRFKAPGDFAQAYVVAHEIGHHVQNLTGVTVQVDAAAREGLEPQNVLSIRMELQADCLAGVWGHSTYERGMLQRGDLDEGMRAAAAVGDDRIQKKTTGRVDPESWTHGSSEQRLAWFVRGFDAGDPDACDTFSNLEA